jgi:hypothetical protein
MDGIMKVAASAVAALLGALLVDAHAGVDVGVSVQIAQPGVYGRVDFGNLPPPPVVIAEPILVAPPRVVVQQAPMYLYVPPGHQKHWAKHCHRYRACGHPVYFVQEQWLRERYESQHQGRHWDRHPGAATATAGLDTGHG